MFLSATISSHQTIQNVSYRFYLVNKKFDEIFDYTLAQYKTVVSSYRKRPTLEKLQPVQ